jgi:cbb3-type cytochrome oxidase maturation protein
MDILVLLIPLSVVLVLMIGAGFWWSVKSGQFDDLEGPAHRILADDDTSDVIPDAPGPGAEPNADRDELTSIKSGPDSRR